FVVAAHGSAGRHVVAGVIGDLKLGEQRLDWVVECDHDLRWRRGDGGTHLRLLAGGKRVRPRAHGARASCGNRRAEQNRSRDRGFVHLNGVQLTCGTMSSMNRSSSPMIVA